MYPHTHSSIYIISKVLLSFIAFPALLSCFFLTNPGCFADVQAHTAFPVSCIKICSGQAALGRVLSRTHRSSLCTRSLASEHTGCGSSGTGCPDPSLPALSPVYHSAQKGRWLWPQLTLMHFYLWVIIFNRKWGLLSWRRQTERLQLSSWEAGLTFENKKSRKSFFSCEQKGRGANGCWWKAGAIES